MRDTRPVVAVTTAVLLASSVWVAAQQIPPRDANRGQAPQPLTGSATISGRVLASGVPAAPIRRATVIVSSQSAANYGARRVVTNDDGSFVVAGLPAGRYFVTATKPAYLTTAFGLTRPSRTGAVVTGTALPLEAGQHHTDVVLTMTRGGVIAGAVRDTDGRPVRGATVALAYFRRTGPSGERSLAGASTMQSQTDSRGMYRIFGVPPGDYVLTAGLTGRDEARDLETTTDADVRRANELSKLGSAVTTPAPQVNEPRRATVGYAPIYYPGTPNLTEAGQIRLAAGEERVGVDLQIQLVPNSRIDGKVFGSDNRPAAGTRVWLTSQLSGGSVQVLLRSTTTDSDGVFRLTGISPGSYAVEVRPEAARAGGPPAMWARIDVSLAGGNDAGVELRLQPGLTVTGRLVFEAGAGQAPEDLSRVRVLLLSESGATNGMGVVDPDGRFVAAGLIPDRYRLLATAPAAPGTGDPWYMKAATVAGVDAVDAAVDLRSVNDLNSALITMTDRVSEISGAIQDAAGLPAPEYFIIVFPADRALWTWNSTRIRQARPARDGKFSFSNLPAGDYLLGAVTDVEQNEWFDPAFLETLTGVSVKVPLAAGGRTVQNLRIR